MYTDGCPEKKKVCVLKTLTEDQGNVGRQELLDQIMVTWVGLTLPAQRQLSARRMAFDDRWPAMAMLTSPTPGSTWGLAMASASSPLPAAAAAGLPLATRRACVRTCHRTACSCSSGHSPASSKVLLPADSFMALWQGTIKKNSISVPWAQSLSLPAATVR